MLPNYPIFFDGTNLANIDGVTVYNYSINTYPQRDLSIYKIATRDYSLLTQAEFVRKEITVDININKASRVLVEQTYLNLKSALLGTNKKITVPQYGSIVNYTGTLYNIEEDWVHIDLDVKLIFTITDPIGINSDISSMFNTHNVTDQADDIVGFIEGSYYASPIITATFVDVTGATGQSVTIKNSQTSQGITVTANWVDGDVLTINSQNKIVTLNGAKVDYSGTFPTFAPGEVVLGYIDSFTDRDVQVEADYYIKYL